MTKRKGSKHKQAIIWTAIATPGVLAFMANVSAKEAASNLASWLEVAGLPVPEFLKSVGIDDEVTEAALAFYALLVGAGSLLVLGKAKPPEAVRHAE